MIKKGFTLIELLIVMAILGVLAVVVLVAINPVEQLAKTRDTGRISGVTQIGRAIQAYYTNRNACWPMDTAAGCPAVAADWGVVMTNSGELSVVPSGIRYSAYSTTACTTAVLPATNGTWCYAFDATNGAIVYSRLESKAQSSKCAGATPVALIVYSTAMGRGGVVCDADADIAVAASYTFVE